MLFGTQEERIRIVKRKKHRFIAKIKLSHAHTYSRVKNPTDRQNGSEKVFRIDNAVGRNSFNFIGTDNNSICMFMYAAACTEHILQVRLWYVYSVQYTVHTDSQQQHLNQKQNMC